MENNKKSFKTWFYGKLERLIYEGTMQQYTLHETETGRVYVCKVLIEVDSVFRGNEKMVDLITDSVSERELIEEYKKNKEKEKKKDLNNP